MVRVYVAGALSAPHPIEYLQRCRIMIRQSVKLLLTKKIAPFCPALDRDFFMLLRKGEEITLDDIYAYSIVWLKVSDYMLVLPGYENSKGTLAEIQKAKEFGIPVFYDMEKLICHISSKKNEKD